MSRLTPASSILSLIALTLVGCASEPAATIQFTGTPGARITGYYVQNGTRIPLAGALPQTLEKANVSMLAVRKINKDDAITIQVRQPYKLRNGNVSTNMLNTGSPAGNADGQRITISGGLSCSVILPGDSLDPPNESLLVLNPYWYQNTWVFDDARFGLKQEAFVRGTPEMIDALVKDVPNARAGFRLSFSQKPFPGYQKKITWVKAQDGGNIYRCDDPPLQGWLCPELFQYFTKTPKELFVRAEPK